MKALAPHNVEMAAAISLLHIAGMPVQCNGCGSCCRSFSLSPALPLPMTQRTAEWIAHVRRVPKPVGQTRNRRRRVFSCDHHDAAVGCTIHDARPEPCSGFPWYELSPDHPDQGEIQDHPSCTFRLQIGRPVEPITEA